MAVPKIREEFVSPAAAAPATPRLTAQLDGMAAQPSPVRALHEQLERHALAAAGEGLEKWSPRRSLAFIVVTAASLWMAILVAGAEAVHAIA